MMSTDVECGDRDPAQLMAALTYGAPFLIEKLLKEQIVETAQQGEALFAEVIKYLILNRMYPDKKWQMSSRLVDEVWHQFVLFTKEYSEFGKRYFGGYLHHAPGNSPSMPRRSPAEVPSLADFDEHYAQLFGTPLPGIWRDTGSITLARRVLLNDSPGAFRVAADDDMVTVIGVAGPMISVSKLAREALEFIVRTKAFYVRELPGDLLDDEKIGLVESLLDHHVVLLGS